MYKYGIPKLTKLSKSNTLSNLLQMHGQTQRHGHPHMHGQPLSARSNYLVNTWSVPNANALSNLEYKCIVKCESIISIIECKYIVKCKLMHCQRYLIQNSLSNANASSAIFKSWPHGLWLVQWSLISVVSACVDWTLWGPGVTKISHYRGIQLIPDRYNGQQVT